MAKKISKQQPDIQQFTTEQVESIRSLVLHNDEVNTFDYVIGSLVDVCRHEPVQAEQCAYITHFCGKCDIRRGEFEKLSPMRKALLDRGLQVTID